MPAETTQIPLGDGYARLDVRTGQRWTSISLDLFPARHNFTKAGIKDGLTQVEGYVLAFRNRCRRAGWKGLPRGGVVYGCHASGVELGPIPKREADQAVEMIVGLLDPANLEDVSEAWRNG